MDIQTDLNKLIILYLQEIHKSLENKSYINDNGKTIIPYGNETHKMDTYRLDQLLWNLPENWYENFLHDYNFIFPKEKSNDDDLLLSNHFEYIPNGEWIPF